MKNTQKIQDLLGITYPIIQAPMAGASTPEMAAAASNAGALGSLGCALMSADALSETVQKTRQLTNRAVNFNFFCHAEPTHDPDKNQHAIDHLTPFYDELGIETMPEAKPTHYPFAENVFEVMVEAAPKVVSFHFGLPETAMVEKLKSNGSVILSSATTVSEAKFLEDNGADAIIAQGFEAGGHRGFFLEAEDACMGTMALVPQVVDAVSLPVIAAGGIADARGIKAALALGAQAAQLGTAFLNCTEAGIPAAHKQVLLEADGANTRTTKLFSGRPARGVINRYMSIMRDHEEALPDFPIMNTLTGPLRKKSAANGSPDFISLWSGQAVGLNEATTTGELVEKLVEEAGL